MNETWAAEVERQLRMLRDKMNLLNQTALRVEGSLGFDLPTMQPTATDEEEIIWIRLTSKVVIGGVNTYAWRRQVYVMTGPGMGWVDNGDAGTTTTYPAVGLNNEDRSTTDGKRYPAKFNPDTNQWIFFLREEDSAYFVRNLKVRQTAGQHYPSGSPGSLVTYDSVDNPANLRFWRNFFSPTSALADNITFSTPLFAWSSLTQVSEGVNTSGDFFAYYNIKDAFGNQIGYVEIKNTYASGYTMDVISIQKMTAVTTPRLVLSGTFSVPASAGTLRFGTSGVYTTAFSSPTTNAIEYWNGAYGGIYRGGGSSFEICWGTGCEAAKPAGAPLNLVGPETTGTATRVLQARSTLSNSILPSRMTTSAIVQVGSVYSDPLFSQIDVSTQATPNTVVFSLPSTNPVAIGSTLTAYSYSEFPTTTATVTTQTTLQIYTVPRAFPAANPIDHQTSLAPVLVRIPILPATVMAPSTSALPIAVTLAFPATTTTAASTTNDPNMSLIAQPITTATIVQSQSAANTVSLVPASQAGVVALTQAGVIAVRPVPAILAEVSPITQLLAFAVRIPSGTSTVVATTQAQPFAVVLPSPAGASATIAGTLTAFAVRQPTPIAGSVAVASTSGVTIVMVPTPTPGIPGATTTLQAVTVRMAQAPITESNPRVTVSTTCYAEAIPAYDYEPFCDTINAGASGWNQLAGLLTIKINGTAITTDAPGTYFGSSATVGFEFTSALIQYLSDNPDVEIVYSYSSFCDSVPRLPAPGSGTVTNGGSVTIGRIVGCSGGAGTIIEPFTITMRRTGGGYLFNSTCSPWGTNQNITTRTATFAFNLEP